MIKSGKCEFKKSLLLFSFDSNIMPYFRQIEDYNVLTVILTLILRVRNVVSYLEKRTHTTNILKQCTRQIIFNYEAKLSQKFQIRHNEVALCDL